ncbi:MAG: helicase C-terminal domain-containing protein [Myxococcota bacterium]
MLRFDNAQKILSLGVHDLIDAGPSRGHLRMQVAWSSRTRMRIGQQIHSRWQADRAAQDASFRREVRVSYRVVVRDWEVHITGRVDGLSQGSERMLVEEVKSSTLPPAQLAVARWEDFPDYARQLQLYLHFLSAQGQAADGRLILISVVDDGRYTLDVPPDPLLDSYLHRQLDWIILEHEERLAWLSRRRAAAAAGLPFPHPQWRPGQKDLAHAVAGALREKKTLLLSAPTGYGKTAAALHAALTVAYENDLRVFFATARTTQQRMAEEVLTEMSRRKMPVRAVSIRAKEKVCLNDVVACRPDACPYAEDYHDRLQDRNVLRRAWNEPQQGCARGVPRPVAVMDLARSARVCPFALSIDMTHQADVVIGDFNYVFDPGVQLSEIGEDLSQWIIVVDEAHNLPERGMGYGSPMLSLQQAEQATLALSDEPAYGIFADVMGAIADSLAEAVVQIPFDLRDGELALPLEEGIDQSWVEEACAQIEALALEYALLKLERPRFASGTTDPWLEVARGFTRMKAALERAKDETVVIWRRGLQDRRGRRRRPSAYRVPGGLVIPEEILTHTRDPDTGMQLLCRDPSRILGPVFQKAAGAVCMSATLEPPDFFLAMLGLDEDKTHTAQFPSPFPIERRQVLVVPSVSTEYRRRQRDRGATARLISEAIAIVPGNLAVFFPSFRFRDDVLPMVNTDQRPVLVQERSMDEDARDQLLQTMARGEGHVLFAVLGGIFSEGVDLPGDGLIAAVVVGPALPQANLSRRLKQEWYQERYGQGFRYAWLVPGMARVVQAAGRVIRTRDDRGSIVLIGRRFLQRDYQDFFPDDWSPERTRNLAASLNGFWDQNRS